MDRRHHRLGKSLQLVESLLHIARKLLSVLRGGQLLHKVDLGAGDEVVLFSGGENHRLHRGVLSSALQNSVEFGPHLGREGVHPLTRLVKGDHRHAVVDAVGEGAPSLHLFDFDCHHTRSRMIAAPRPPAAQTVHSAVLRLLRLSSPNACRTTRAPVAANGWPRAIEPPLTLSLVRSTSPSGAARPIFFANSKEAKACRFDATCDANASCISKRSMSLSFICARSSAN